jgi:predicted HAD superfamily Cof-like phosphohydrolase
MYYVPGMDSSGSLTPHSTRALVTHPPDLVEIADGCADISVVTIGTLVACGIPDKGLLELVDDNNLNKFKYGLIRDQFGKIVKPTDHQPPNIAAYLNSVPPLEHPNTPDN